MVHTVYYGTKPVLKGYFLLSHTQEAYFNRFLNDPGILRKLDKLHLLWFKTNTFMSVEAALNQAGTLKKIINLKNLFLK